MLRKRLEDALKEQMLARDERAVSTLRLILAALKDRDIAERGKGNPSGLGDDQIMQLLQSMIKQRRESIELYKQGGREELANLEAEEIVVIEQFLPEQMTEEQIVKEVSAVIDETEAKTLKDVGRVMAELKQRFAGRMDFAKASNIIKGRLS